VHGVAEISSAFLVRKIGRRVEARRAEPHSGAHTDLTLRVNVGCNGDTTIWDGSA